MFDFEPKCRNVAAVTGTLHWMYCFPLRCTGSKLLRRDSALRYSSQHDACSELCTIGACQVRLLAVTLVLVDVEEAGFNGVPLRLQDTR